MQQKHLFKAHAGVRNLLLNCAGAARGDRVLLAYEPDRFGHFSADLCATVAEGARALGMHVTLLDVGFSPYCTQLPAALTDHFAEVDVVVFLARLGDQLRFTEMPEGPKFVVCFAFNGDLLGSSFGTADYRAFQAAKRIVDDRLFSGRQITITCPAGTMVEGHVGGFGLAPSDTSSARFPLSVFSPVPAQQFSGDVALAGFLTGTGSHYYDDYTLGFDSQVIAHFETGRLRGFSGAGRDVALANDHYDRVARRFNLDRNFVHSWHAGIHPGCGFPWDLWNNDKRWGTAAFGNPRLLHFHTCGDFAPGEISWNVIDPTIEVDGIALWENGRFHLERLDEGADILAQYPCAAAAFANPNREIGLSRQAPSLGDTPPMVFEGVIAGV